MCVRMDVAIVQKNLESLRAKDLLINFVPIRPSRIGGASLDLDFPPAGPLSSYARKRTMPSPSATREGNKKQKTEPRATDGKSD